MSKSRVAILGASGIGKFHVHEFALLGCEIVAILGSSKESSEKTSEMLKKEFGVNVKPYSDINSLLRNEKLDAVSICSPPEFHEEMIRSCLAANLHVLCEKPLVRAKDDLKTAKELFSIAKKNKKILTMNAQWASVIPYMSISSKINRISINMEPGVKGKEMLYDHLPHMNSILVKLIPKGKVSKIKLAKNGEESAKILFNYSNTEQSCDVEYILNFKASRPRAVKIKINNDEYNREIGDNYQQFLVSKKAKVKIEDPLRVSIKMFLDSIIGKKPLNTEENIIENIKLQLEIISKY